MNGWTVVIFGTLVIGSYVVGNYESQHAAAAPAGASFDADALSTPETFIAHCGAPSRRMHGTLTRDFSASYPAPRVQRTDKLVYQLSQSDHWDFILSDSKDYPGLVRTHTDPRPGKVGLMLPADVIVQLGCRA